MTAKTAAAKLYTTAADLLRKQTPEKAAPAFWQALVASRELRDALLLDYLGRVATEMAAGVSQNSIAAPIGHATSAAGSVRVKAHDVRAHRRRTQKEKDAAIAAKMMTLDAIYEHKIDGMPIGDIPWERLQGLVRKTADSAVRNLVYGTSDTADAILLKKCVAYGRVDDGRTPVRKVVPAAVLAKFAEEARAEAPLLVEEGMREQSARIAAERTIEHVV